MCRLLAFDATASAAGTHASAAKSSSFGRVSDVVMSTAVKMMMLARQPWCVKSCQGTARMLTFYSATGATTHPGEQSRCTEAVGWACSVRAVESLASALAAKIFMISRIALRTSR